MPFEHVTTPMKPAPANDMAGHRIASLGEYETATERVRELADYPESTPQAEELETAPEFPGQVSPLK